MNAEMGDEILSALPLPRRKEMTSRYAHGVHTKERLVSVFSRSMYISRKEEEEEERREAEQERERESAFNCLKAAAANANIICFFL